MTIAAAELRARLSYDPSTGIFAWVEHRIPTRIGVVAGRLNDRGYVVISIGSKTYKAHRLAWVYMTGEWPADQVDHRNGVKCDNRWHNLRTLNNQHNNENRNRPYRNNKSGFLGVHQTPTKPGVWIASIQIDGRKIALGSFPTAEAANAAYLVAKAAGHKGYAST